MSPKIANFFKAFDNLSPPEKAELQQLLIRRQTSVGHQLDIINAELRRAQTINFAPGPGSCPTCGK